MPNIILTTRCPAGCPWCFAEPTLRKYRDDGVMELSWNDFLNLVDFYKKSNIHSIALLGGEPTLHSRIVDIIEYLEKERFDIHIGSCGILPEKTLDELCERPFKRVKYGLNTTLLFDFHKKNRDRINQFLSKIDTLNGISYTITFRDVEGDLTAAIMDRIDLMETYSIRKHITFQIAVPCDGNSQYVPFQHLKPIITKMLQCFLILAKNKVTYNLDCHSIPQCLLPEHPEISFSFRKRCDFFPIDIGPNLDVWPCFPLADLRANLYDFRSFEDVREYFNEQRSKMRLEYEKECAGCTEKSPEKCTGGCYGYQNIRKITAKQKKRTSLQIEEQDIRNSIVKGIRFLESRQKTSGEIPVRVSTDRIVWKPAIENSVFCTTSLLLAFSKMDNAAAARIRRKGAQFVLDHIEPPGKWRYWYNNPIEPDLDDTACASLALLECHPDLLFRRNLEMIYENRDERGLFKTWLSKGDNDVDSVVNANVVMYVGDSSYTKATINWIEEVINSGREKDSYWYYEDPFALYYAVSRAMTVWKNTWTGLREVIKKRIQYRIGSEAWAATSLLNAQALCSLHNIGDRDCSLAKALARDILSKQRDDGSWEVCAAWNGPKAPSERSFWWGSEEYTTGICLEALAGCITTVQNRIVDHSETPVIPAHTGI